MEVVFGVICMLSGAIIGIGVAILIGKKWGGSKKIPDWVPELIGAILAFGGLFGGAWFADAYKQSIIDQTYQQVVDSGYCNDLND
ncbi:MAG: hypothetical protein K6G49_02035 [Candidatus Saccharibacteria bacterium]|nr:hypothetical protein [Candidatus Saccharibacteria bacterium]